MTVTPDSTRGDVADLPAPARGSRASPGLGGGSGGQFREVGGSTPVDLGDRVGVVPQRGGAAAAVAEAGGGVPQVEAPARSWLAV
jgi:hypothetical protein